MSDHEYFRLGSKFLRENATLLGFHLTDTTTAIGTLDEDVQSALNLLAIEVCRRMARIMRDDLPAD